MDQSKLVMVKHSILGNSELKWIGIVNLIQMTLIFTTVGKKPLEEKEWSSRSTRVWNAVLGCNLKNDRMILVRFQGKPLNITVIQVYTPTTGAEEAEVEWFCEDYKTF